MQRSVFFPQRRAVKVVPASPIFAQTMASTAITGFPPSGPAPPDRLLVAYPTATLLTVTLAS